MKSKLFIIILLCFSKSLMAQDTLHVSTVVDSAFKTPQYETVFDDVFLSHQETKWLFKVDWMPLLASKLEADNRFFGIEFERKIGSNFSVNTGLYAGKDIFDDYYWAAKQLSLVLEPRWYLFANQEQNRDKSANNLNGQYISFRAFLGKFLNSENVLGTLNYLEEQKISLNYGLQKRVFNNWYANFRTGLAYTKHQNPRYGLWLWSKPSEFGFDSEFTLGLAFGNKKIKNKIETCSVFRCFEEENHLFKMDVSGLLQKIKKNSIYSQFIAAYETKIHKSAWSLNTELRIDIDYDKSGTQGVAQDVSDVRRVIFSFEPRFYYNLQKRIASGKSANNLSGNYFALAVGYNWGEERYKYTSPGFSDGYRHKRRMVSLAPKWGLQRRIFKHGFADIAIAPLQLNIGSYAGRNNTAEWGVLSYPIFDARVGFAF